MGLERKRLISRLEGMFENHIYNRNNPIRYPITFEMPHGTRELRGTNSILNVDAASEAVFYRGAYVFGANKLFIYQALNEILDYLESEGALDLSCFYDVDEDKWEDEQEDDEDEW